jgi:hypothetical protein
LPRPLRTPPSASGCTRLARSRTNFCQLSARYRARPRADQR